MNIIRNPQNSIVNYLGSYSTPVAAAVPGCTSLDLSDELACRAKDLRYDVCKAPQTN